MICGDMQEMPTMRYLVKMKGLPPKVTTVYMSVFIIS